MWRHNTFRTLCILTPLVCAFAFALDIYIPSVPKLPAYFHTSELNVQLTLSLFLLVNGLGQLVAGPLSDQIGRKKIALMSVVIFIIGSLFCAISTNILLLIISRVFQALGTAGCMIVAFACIRDIYDGNNSSKMFTYINSCIAVSPMLAPVIGSFLDLEFGWRASFIFLIFLGLFAFYMVSKNLAETLPIEKRVKIDKTVFARYWEILKTPQFLLFSLGATTGVVCFFNYFSASSYIYIVLLKTSQIQFGLFFALTALTSTLGGVIGGKLCDHYGIAPSMWLGSVLMLVGSMVMCVNFLISGMSLGFFLGSMCLIAIGATTLIGASSAAALAPFKNIAGTATALLNVIYFTIAAVIGALLLKHGINSYLPLALLLLSMAVMACFISCFSHRNWIKS